MLIYFQQNKKKAEASFSIFFSLLKMVSRKDGFGHSVSNSDARVLNLLILVGTGVLTHLSTHVLTHLHP
jgi:hypothetical protein